MVASQTLTAPVVSDERPKRGTRFKLQDGREATLVSYAFGKANLKNDGGATFVVPVSQIWNAPANPAPKPADKSVFEGQVNAILGIIGMGEDFASAKYPEYHTVRVSKRPAHPGEPPQVEKYLGWGYTKLSEDPVDSGGADMILMGVPLEVWAEFEKHLDNATNGWKQDFTRIDGDFAYEYEESEKQSLEDLQKGFSS